MEDTKSNLFGRFGPISLLASWLAVAPLLFSSTLTLFIIEQNQWVLQLERSEWAVLYVLAVFTMAFALTPTTFLAVVSGYYLGFSGLIFLVLAYQMASLVGYYLGLWLGKDFVVKFLKQKKVTRSILSNIQHKQLITTILARISPALPFGVMNLVLAVSGIRLRHFFWGGLIGMLPRTIFFVWVGYQAVAIREALDRGENVFVLVAATLVVFVLFYWLLRPIRSKTY